jgi:hypothetical protein
LREIDECTKSRRHLLPPGVMAIATWIFWTRGFEHAHRLSCRDEVPPLTLEEIGDAGVIEGSPQQELLRP